MDKAALCLCDVHSHILPGMDDGCQNPKESIRVLQACLEQGVRRMFLTPHYYPQETVETFLQRRREAGLRLVEQVQKQPCRLPQLYLGAEVAYHPGLVYEERLNRLCLGHSPYLLLELPFSKWPPRVLRDVQAIQTSRGLVPVIAHLERYFKMQEKSTIEELTASGVLIQMNAEYLIAPWTRRHAKRLLRNGVVQLLGSDCHNLTKRPPNLAMACECLLQAGMEEQLEALQGNAAAIFEKA